MKKILILIAVFIAHFQSQIFLVDASGEESIEDVVQNILTDLSVDDLSDLKCSNLSEQHFERMGKAVIHSINNEELQGELLNSVVGEEGTEAWKHQHEMLGRHYLGCSNGSEVVGYNGMMGGWRNHMFGGTGFSWVITLWIAGWIIFYSLIIYFVILGIRKLSSLGDDKQSHLGILKDRYAKGEITKDEYEEKKKDLS